MTKVKNLTNQVISVNIAGAQYHLSKNSEIIINADYQTVKESTKLISKKILEITEFNEKVVAPPVLKTKKQKEVEVVE